MKRWNSISYHEIAYDWTIKAPDNLTADDLEALQQALCSYTDDPNTDTLKDMLDYSEYCEGLDQSKLEDFAKCTIYSESSHREQSYGTPNENKER